MDVKQTLEEKRNQLLKEFRAIQQKGMIIKKQQESITTMSDKLVAEGSLLMAKITGLNALLEE